MARVLVPLPDVGFDVTEVAVPWHLLRQRRHEVVFCTERGGLAPSADPLLISGVPFRLGARAQPIAFYRELERDDAFRDPLPWRDVEPLEYAAVLLPGGHAPGTRQYLGDPTVQKHVASFFKGGLPVGAICHGVLVAARSRDPDTGRSVLYERKTTCLAKYQELGGYLLTRWKLGRYYRTYPACVEDEVKTALRDPHRQFERGPITLTARDTATNPDPAFVVVDGNYVSARWPGDAYTFARTFARIIESGLGESPQQG